MGLFDADVDVQSAQISWLVVSTELSLFAADVCRCCVYVEKKARKQFCLMSQKLLFCGNVRVI